MCINGKTSTAGITLVALIVTIVVLLILAGITIMYVFGDNSVFKKVSDTKLKAEIAKAREKIEIVLTNVQVEKQINPKYNEKDFLDEYILENIEGSEVIDDIVIADNYAFSIDRNVPKIGEYIGKKEDLVLPELEVNEPALASDNKIASFTIKAKEEKEGISKIEIWQEGHVIKTYEYSNEKGGIEETYDAKQNGKYVVKVYAKYSTSKIVKVIGIVPTIKFEPNGNAEYQKEHFTKIKMEETTEKVVSIKYQWTNSTEEPGEETFQESCKIGDTITKKGITGTYYLWTLISMESGSKSIWRSEGFNFDNEGPEITAFTATKYSETGITLSVTAQDNRSGVVKFEFYIDNVLKDTQTCSVTTSSITQTANIIGLSTGGHNCKVIVYDAKENDNSRTKSGVTKLYAWEKWDGISGNAYIEKRTVESEDVEQKINSWTGAKSYTFDAETRYVYFRYNSNADWAWVTLCWRRRNYDRIFFKS